jgi:hypothetical protein
MSDDTDSRAAYPELLADLADQVAIKCVSLGIDPARRPISAGSVRSISASTGAAAGCTCPRVSLTS